MSVPGRVQNIKKQFEDVKDSESPYYRAGPLLLSKPRDIASALAPAGIKRSPAFRNDKIVPRKTPVPTPRTGALPAASKPITLSVKKSAFNGANKAEEPTYVATSSSKNQGQPKIGDSPPKRAPVGINGSAQKAAIQLSRVLVESNSKGLLKKSPNQGHNAPLISHRSPQKMTPPHELLNHKLVKVTPPLGKLTNNNSKNSTPKLITFGSPPSEPCTPKTVPRPSPPGPLKTHPKQEEMIGSPLPKGPPPQKPPRTFAHSLNYFELKAKEEPKRPPVRSVSGPLRPTALRRPSVPPPAMPARSKTESQIVRKNKNRSKALLAACVCPPPQYKDPAVPVNSELSRSQSMEHVYAVPFVPKVEDGVPVKYPIQLTKTNKQGLYYMSTPIQWPARPNNLPVNSFNPQRSPKTSPPCAKVLPTLRESPKFTHDAVMDQSRIQFLVNEAFNSVQLSTPDPSTDSEDCLTPSDREFAMIMDRSSPSEDDNEEEAKRVVEKRKGYVKRASSFAMSQSRVPLDRTNLLFDSVLLVGLHLDQDTRSYKPYIKSKFPANAQVPEDIKYFVFPDSDDWPPNEGGDHNKPYSIVLTSALGERSYGYCRRVVPEGTSLCLPLAYCILTKHRASGFFYKLLAELESRHGQPDAARISMLSSMQPQHLPKPGCSLTVPSLLIVRPPDQRLEDADLSALFSCLPSKVLLRIVASVLHERQVVLVSSSLSKLTASVTALQAALEPFQWQHTLVAALPSNMTEICNAPTPFIVGVLKSKTGVTPNFSIEEGIAVDLDIGKATHQVGDECKILPGRLQKALCMALQVVASTTAATETLRNVLISEAFVRFFVETCGHYRNHIVTQQDGKTVFERESFVKAVESRSLQLFLEWFTETSLFTCFIDDRTNLSSGNSFSSNSVFDTRVQQHFKESEKNSLQLMKNYKIINKKVKTFGDRIRDLVH